MFSMVVATWLLVATIVPTIVPTIVNIFILLMEAEVSMVNN